MACIIQIGYQMLYALLSIVMLNTSISTTSLCSFESTGVGTHHLQHSRQER